MATASEIIEQAFREGNFTAVGEVPTAAEIAEALPRLRSLVDSVFGTIVGERYREWYAPSELQTLIPLRRPLSPTGTLNTSESDTWKFLPANVRVHVKTAENRSLWLPANPSDGARVQLLNIGSLNTLSVTIDGNGHLIEGAASLTDTLANLHARSWLYRADLGNWVRYTGIVDGASTMPLPDEFDDYFVCGLAMRLAPRFQVPIAEETVSRFREIRGIMKTRYKQTEEMPASFGELHSSQPATTWDL